MHCVITGSPLINRGQLGSVVRMSISTMLCLNPSTDPHIDEHVHPPTQMKDLAVHQDGCFDIKTAARNQPLEKPVYVDLTVSIYFCRQGVPLLHLLYMTAPVNRTHLSV